jgi:NAD(P)-dependent dehydrogenase (short-subunit alcohol dehydrogenase family)
MRDEVVLVTGGAGNLGRSVTRAFLEAGANVAVPFYKTDPPDALQALQNEFGERLLLFGFDLTTERGAAEAVREVLEWRGRLGVVAHLVGGYRGGARIVDTPVEAWDRMIDLNLKSAWLMSRAAIPALIDQGGGGLIFVSSRAARTGRAGHAAYAVAKSALIALMEAIIEEYGAEGIRANAVMPGILDTEDNRRAMPDADFSTWTQPEQIARTILFLASPDASVVSGASIPVYGLS